MKHKTPDGPPRPKRDRQMRRKISWALAIFMTAAALIAQVLGDPDRLVLLGLASICLILCLSADRRNAKVK